MFKRMKKQQSKANNQVQHNEIDSIDFSINEQELRTIFKESGDVFFNPGVYRPESPLNITLIGCQGLIDLDLLNRLVIDRLNLFFERYPSGYLTKEDIVQSLYLPQLTEVTTKNTMFADIYCGKLLIFIHEYNYLFSTNIAHRPQRTPEQTATEVTINGPRDNFIEDISVNVALIRKRLRTNSLCVKKFQVGKRSLTEVALLYIHDVANPDMVEDVSEKIRKVDVDGIYSGSQFMELIEKTSPFIPRHHYSGRPDFAIECLLKGRMVIIIDGVANAMITPINGFLLIKSAEDSENISAWTSLERTLRVVGVFSATLLPGFWVAINTYHQNQVPLILLATVVESRRGVPFPTAVEAVLMLLLFELFKEAGLRMPSAAGGTLSVLGALIIGDAAIRAGLTSPSMLVVIAGSSIATFTLINQSLIGAISVARLFCIILSSILGMFGFLLTLHFLLILVCNMRILGVPFIGITANLNLKYFLKSILRIPSKLDTTRFNPIISEDSTKKRE